MINYGDIIFQTFLFIIVIAVILAIVVIIKNVTNKNGYKQSKAIEHKLDRIIDLLEKDKQN
ncbi:DUF4083 family protein [Niallia nealsonii]|nr:DUF4083 family protein [Niallia nealsonii]